MTGEPRSRVAPLPWWYEQFLRFVTIRFICRVVFGRRLEGGKRTGWWTNGRVMALRWSIVLWCAYTIWLAAISLVLVKVWFSAMAIAGLVFGGKAVYGIVKAWWLREIIAALHDALHDPQNLVGWDEDERPSRYLHVPFNWNTGEGAKIRIEFKPGFAIGDERRDRFTQVIGATLGTTIKPRNMSFHTKGKRPYVEIRPPWDPPPVAWFKDNIERLETGRKPGEFYAGIGDHNKLVKVNLKETPHVGIAAQTNRGKSQTIANASCQLLHDAAAGVALDPKGASLRCFMGLENVAYAGDYDEADDAILRLVLEFERRKTLLRQYTHGGKKPDVGPRIIIIIEEADSLMAGLRAYHRTLKTQGPPPSIDGLLMLRNMGREYLMTQLFVTQSGSARASGSGDGRSQIGSWLISADVATWKKIDPTQTKPPPISPTIGRFHLLRYGAVTEVQGFGFEEPRNGSDDEKMAEARDYAMSGDVTPVPEYLYPFGPIPQWMQTLIDAKGWDLSKRDTPKLNVSEPMVSAGNGYVGPMSGTHVGDTPHLRLVDPVDGEERPVSLATVIGTVQDDERWLTLSEAMKAGIIPPKSMNAVRIAARKSELLKAHSRYREGPPTAGAKEYPQDVLERYAARERTNA